MKTGFTFYLPRDRVDIFVPCSNQNRTLALARKILVALGYPATESEAINIRSCMRPATFEEVETESGKRFYRITGNNFGIMDPVESGSTRILTI